MAGKAETTGLPDGTASVVFSEAMLSMQTAAHKETIVAEAARLLKPSGRYGIHELCLLPDDLETSRKSEISQASSQSIHVGARPLTPGEWTGWLKRHGLTVDTPATTPMRLLEPGRFIRDEGLARSLRFAWRLMTRPTARRRILAMRAVFRTYAEHMGGITLVGVKKETT